MLQKTQKTKINLEFSKVAKLIIIKMTQAVVDTKNKTNKVFHKADFYAW